jgi:hypothetical protein
MTTLKTYQELDKWLSDNFYFEDGHILSISENPFEIIVGYDVAGNYEANSERQILPFKLIPSKIIEWTFDNKLSEPSEYNYIEGLDAVEVENGICLQFSTPTTFKLVTDILNIDEQDLIITTFRPWTSETEIFITADLNEIPRPEFWQQKLNSIGHKVSFRYYCSEAISSEKVPYPNYEGYYIQIQDKITSTKEGIFLKYLKTDKGKLNLGFENKDEDLAYIWDDFTSILSDLPNAKINSGNCTFTGTDWKKYLADRILPSTE